MTEDAPMRCSCSAVSGRV